ncbi:hypothetical protein Ddye_007678 [Dipteronia dyeriana]|uniref:Uncharacterized protein n=1 Tax=Dipteronia dyeriana TaxID=168575 RepID=A0AAD9XKY8_9ROSI|nr:hypothetical protein Ddye_007678 [Dipteronia dyeriana]
MKVYAKFSKSDYVRCTFDRSKPNISEAANDDDDGDDDVDYNDNGSELGNSDEERSNVSRTNHAAVIVPKHVGSRWSIRLAGGSNHPDVETRNLGTQNRLRQRPTRNSALDTVVLDSESDGEKSLEQTNSKTSGDGNLSIVADSEEEVSDS